MKREITIAGGGLAGLALGLALRRRDVPVRIFEAAAYPRHRVCGEFISGLRESELRELGIDEVFAHAHRHCSVAWFEDNRPLLSHRLPEPAFGLSRHHLDAALAERFCSAGGALRCGERFGEKAEGVVWASGRAKSRSGWLGIKAHYEEFSLAADLEVHLQDGGYVGLTRVEGDRVNVCGLFSRPPGDGSDPLVSASEGAGLRHLAARLRTARVVEGSTKGVTHFSLGWQSSPPDRVCIGDAAAMIPPFTGNGMSMAIQGALVTAEPVAAWSRGECSWSEVVREVRRRHRNSFGRRLRWARFLQAVLLRRAGRKAARLLLASGVIKFDTIYSKLR